MLLARRVEDVQPGVADTLLDSEGGTPNLGSGPRPATPTNRLYIGKTGAENLWVNADHGTLGWTHGAGLGTALAELISNEKSAMAFDFYGI